MKTENLEQRTIEPIVVGNLALDGEAVRGSDGEYLVQTQQEWINHLAGTGARLPTLPEYFAFIHHLQKENHPASREFIARFVRILVVHRHKIWLSSKQ